MNDQDPAPRVKRLSVGCIAALAFATIIVVAGLLFPIPDHHGTAGRSGQAKNDVRQIVSAVRGFYTEYGRYPSVTPDGLILDAASNARLFNILRALDHEANPRRIVFFEGRIISERASRPVAGFDPAGTLFDPWGSAYRLAMDADYDARVPNPYKDGEPMLRASIIAWSPGKDGVQAERRSDGGKRPDDVVSWD